MKQETLDYLATIKTEADNAATGTYITFTVQCILAAGLIIAGINLNQKIDGIVSQVEDVHGHVSTQNNRTPDVSVYIQKDGKYVKAEESSTWNTFYYTN